MYDDASRMTPQTFTVDTHLFRELGELLVGRDSTALVELVKNAYDADATEVVVHGQDLDDARHGYILVTDNGAGMSKDQFLAGFLRIASRVKEDARRSTKFKRRFTGAKGVGRLAAHKLAGLLEVESTPANPSDFPITASINWKKIEELDTLDQIPGSGAVQMEAAKSRPPTAKSGTTISLRNLKRRWSAAERTRFLAEVQTFSAPNVLVNLPKDILASRSLLAAVDVRDAKGGDPGFEVRLEGDFDVGDEYWQNIASAASWAIEISAVANRKTVQIAVTPTKTTVQSAHRLDKPAQRIFNIPHPTPEDGPHFQARIMVREGRSGTKEQQQWLGRVSGIRVYVEGFRVLPYGEPNDDWLEIDSDYASRPRTLTYLKDIPAAGAESDDREGLLFLQNQSYFGAVFITLENAKSLQMLVNREGFIPNASLDAMVSILRTAVHLSVRVRAAASFHQREEDRRSREAPGTADDSPTSVTSRRDLRLQVDAAVSRAAALASEARESAAQGDFKEAKAKIDEAAKQFAVGSVTHHRLMTEGSMLRVLASVGTQMASFVHEIKGLLASASAVEASLNRLRKDQKLPGAVRTTLATLHSSAGDLRRSVERQASFLTDITSPDARRKRSRQPVAQRFDSAQRVLARAAERRGVAVTNLIPPELRSPSMFSAELTVVFTNLLSNAIKNAGEHGKVRVTGRVGAGGAVILRMENTGVEVDLNDSERWFRPFESTTTEADPVLGQGMGMGLPITRNVLEEYGGSIRFLKPSSGYATAIEVLLPE